MRYPKRHARLALRLVAIALVVAGTVIASSLLDLLQSAVDSSAGVGAARLADALRPLPLAIPMVLVGVALLVVTTRQERIVSLTRRNGET